MTKKVLIREIVEYIDKSYKNDPRIVGFVKKFREIEAKSLKKSKKITKKQKNKNYTVTKEARDWLAPLVDAEYFKYINYNFKKNIVIDDEMIKAMQCLETDVYSGLKNNIMAGK